MKRVLMVALAAVLLIVARAILRAPDPVAVRAEAAPLSESPEARGRVVYERYGCVMCHGKEGKGGFANPNSETDGKVPGVLYVAEAYTRAEARKRVLDGTPTIGRSDPKGPRPPYRMPGWRGRMTDAEVGDVVDYLFSIYPKASEKKWR
jgi:mono/diheme cytochrome c family protein